MKKFLLLFFCFSTCLIYGQLVWEETNTGTSATISVGEFPVWEMEDPTLNGAELPVGSLIGVFYVGDDGGYYCGGGETWLGEGLIALGPWGDDSTTGVIDGFSEGETFNWFVRVCDSDCWDDLDGDGILDSGEVLDGTDYFASSAQMVPSNGQLTGTVYTTNALAGLLSANFTEYVEGEEEVEDLTCECSYGMAIPNGDSCFIFNACSDPLSNNYCEGLGSDFTTYFQEACEYDTAIEGCTCPEAVNYDETASVDDGTCYVVDGGCSDSLADNYSGSECTTATFLEENCEYSGCICPEAYNYDTSATIDDGSCWVLSGGCSDPTANNYSGDLCVGSNYAAEDCQYTPIDVDLVWEYDITDGNMTVQIGADVVTFNGEEPPIGSLIGAFFINDDGEYSCGGYLEWTGDQLALAVWAAESGYDNGFETGEEIIWALSIAGEDFLANSSEMNSTAPFTTTFVSNGFGQLLSAVFEGELTSILGCTDSTAFNYNDQATVDDGSCYTLDFDYTVTDGNMTIQVASSAIQFNGEEPPCGSLLGGFYTNDSGQLICGGYQVWCDDFSNEQLAVPLFASESGLDNGFETGEEITWILSVYGQSFLAESVTMNPTPPFSTTFIANGFGQLLVGLFSGEIDGVLGCTNESADNFNPEATIDDGSCTIPGCTDSTACNYDSLAITDDGSCYYEIIWYYDLDGDGLGSDIYTSVGCESPGPEFVDNNEDPCPTSDLNDQNDNGICDADEVLGCMNVNATNYDISVNVDDGSCIIPGCTDPTALNYSEEATEDNGTCIAVIEGCMDSTAFNYSEEANTDDDSCCYIAGCIDSTAFNYNLNACFDDGSCIAIIEGCTDPSSFNYNNQANVDDGSCQPYIFGCMDSTACNYDDTVNTDNSTCVYPEEYYDCDENCLVDSDGDGVCDTLEILGCVDSEAFNYNPAATDDDGSCIAVIEGCMDSTAFNYSEQVNTDDDSCCYIAGCTDTAAWNYSNLACFDDGSCEPFVYGCTDSSAFNYSEDVNTDDGSCEEYVYGCMDLEACNYDVSVNTDNGSCSYPEEYYDCDNNCLNDIDGDGTCDELEIGGCTNPVALNYNPAATDDDFCLFPGCLDTEACNYDPEGFYYELVSCDYDSCAGCTDATADNYNPEALIDDGSCIIPGCTDATACNYNPSSTDDDGSCYNNDLGCGCDESAAEEGYDCDGICLVDTDGDGVCDEFEVLGCTDITACNYVENATDDDGSCYNNDLGCGCDESAAEEGYDCDGVCLVDTDGDGVCDEFEILGCTDFIACNYDNNATDDDASCEYAIEGYDCDGNELELDSPWGNNDGCDPFNNHTVAFTVDGLSIGDFVGLFYTDDNGDIVFSQAVEYGGDNFYFTVCGDDTTTDEKDGFDDGESFIWQLWPLGEDCAYTIEVEYETTQPSLGEYEQNGISQVISFSGTSLSAEILVTDALCNGDFGSAELTVTGGTAPYETDDLSILSAGSYSTTVTDATGCAVILDFEVTEPSLLEATISVTDVLCNGDFGSAELTVTGGTAPYETDDLSILSAGSYSTTVTDANGCTVTLDFEVTEPSLLEATVSVTDALCNGDFGSAELIVTGGTAPYETDDLSSLVAGTYNTTVTDANGCTVTLDFEVTEPSLLEATVSVTDALCNGNFGSAELIVTGGTAPYEIDDLSTLLAGSYNTIVTDANGCIVTLDFEIVEPELLEVSVVVNDILCNGDLGSAELIVTGGTAPYETDDLSDLAGGDYTTMVVDANGCESSVDFVITEPDPIEVIVTTTDVTCNGESNGSVSVEITGGTGDYDYEIQTEAAFNIDSELVFVDDLDDLSAGDYVITTLDSNGCFDITEFSISEPEELSLTFETTPGEYSNCGSGTASVFVDGGTLGYEYLWSNGEVTSEITGLCGGDYSVVVTDSNGCEIEGVVTVEYVVPEGWEVVETDLIHTIDIPLNVIMLLDQVDLVSGDYVGVFFDNEDGTQSCGGYVMLVGESTQILAYGNDGVNDGFEQGEQFNWKMWNSVTETTINGFAVYDESYSDERYFNTGGESGLLGSIFATYQLIPLNENPYSDWDMISTYMSTDETVESIFNPVLDDLIIIKDANGLVYWPLWDIITLNNMSTDDAYAIKTWSPNELLVYGDFIQPEEISFQLSGWNYISYPRYFPAEVDVALSSVLGNIKLLKDDSGNIYWPELGMNTIGQMEAGEGYVLKVMGDQTFNYPSNSDNVVAVDGSTTAGRIGLTQPVYYSDFQKTNKNMVVGLPLENWNNFDIEYGDEIAVLDNEGNIVGVSVLEVDNNVLVIWGDDESSLEKDGMMNGEKLNFELWKSSSNTLYNVSFEWTEGTDNYVSNGINLASSIIVEEKYENNFEFISCYPNPTSGEFSLEFNLNNEDNITISIFNSIGERVYRLNNKSFTSGLHSLPISLSHLGQGLYYIELQSQEKYQNVILDLTK